VRVGIKLAVQLTHCDALGVDGHRLDLRAAHTGSRYGWHGIKECSSLHPQPVALLPAAGSAARLPHPAIVPAGSNDR
jgi:hypothetical protein